MLTFVDKDSKNIMYKNLAHYIKSLKSSDNLITVLAQVDPELEITEIVDRLSKEPGGGGAILFENTATDFPVLCNMMGSERRMAMALGVESLEELPARVDELLSILKTPRKTLRDKLSLLPVLGRASRWFPRHSRRRGECQEVIFRGEEVDLGMLPILRTWVHDGGRFITLPLVHTEDRDSKVRNVGMYRMQVLGSRSTAMHWHIHKTGERHYQSYKRAGERMPVAVCLGGDPAYTYAATAPLPEGIDEYILAGFLRKKPVKLVKCITNDLEVPADCDIVIEGYVDPAEDKVVEGPFGDHTGFYSLPDLYPVFHVTAITHRRGAIYPATIVGVPPMEDRYIARASELIFAEPIKAVIAPEIRSLTMPWQGVAHNVAMVEIEKSYSGQAMKVAQALWGAGQMSFCKVIWIDGEEHSDRDLKGWLVGGVPFSAELHFSSGVADVLEHASDRVGVGSKLCVDMTSDGARRWSVETQFDSEVEALNDDEKLWLLLANIDPKRDIVLDAEHGVIRIDARSKELKERDFPNVVTADIATIELVDGRWQEYGIGEFIASPSRRYLSLIRNNGAKQ